MTEKEIFLQVSSPATSLFLKLQHFEFRNLITLRDTKIAAATKLSGLKKRFFLMIVSSLNISSIYLGDVFICMYNSSWVKKKRFHMANK